MNTIEQMIHDLCPNGVKRVRLGEVCQISTGKLNANAMVDGGAYPFFTCSDKIFQIDSYAFDCEALLVAGNGYLGNVKYYKGKFNAYQRTYVLNTFAIEISVMFLYYYIKAFFRDYALSAQNDASVPYITLGTLQSFEIPLPPLSIQAEIVKILDRFAVLTAELEAELENQKKRYEYYRTRLLSFAPDSTQVQWKALGEVGTMAKGNGIQKSDFTECGIPCIHYGQVHTKFHTYTDKNITFVSEDFRKRCKFAQKGDLIIATTSEDVEACCKAVVWLGEEDVAISGDAHIFHHNQNPKYMSYLFQTEMFAEQKRRVATGAKVVRVHGEDILKFKFAFPSLEEQARIVNYLDRYEQLIYGSKDSIPELIDNVQKQYEFYRNKLLTFPEA